MRFRPIFSAVLVAIVAAGCLTMSSRGEEGIKPTPGSNGVEVISEQRVSVVLGSDCERLSAVRATLGPFTDPETKDGRSKIEIKARNMAYELGATHVAVGTQESYPCNLAGNHCGQCGGQCFELPATAYRCERETTSTSRDRPDRQADDRPDVDQYRTNIDPAKYMKATEAANYCDADEEIIWGFIEDDIVAAYHTEYGVRLLKEDVKSACEQDVDSPPSKYMTVDEAAEYCGTEARDIWQDLEDGTLRSHQTEDGIRIAKSEVEKTCEPTKDKSQD